MAVINRTSIQPPSVLKETVAVPALGGDVVVRGLLLSERLGINQQITTLRKKQADDETAMHSILPTLLALCVIDAEAQPVFDKAGWEQFGGQHTAQAVDLFNIGWRLSGFSGADETKN